MQKAGVTQVNLVLRSLQGHPGRLSPAVLRSRLSVVGGDGAVAAGGADAQHGSTGAAEKLWSAVMAGTSGVSADVAAAACTEWDLFHRVDAALSRTMKDDAAIMEIMDLARALGALFATGDGRALYRSTQLS